MTIHNTALRALPILLLLWHSTVVLAFRLIPNQRRFFHNGPILTIQDRVQTSRVALTDDMTIFTGTPSTVGWRSGRLNRLTQWTESHRPNRPVICEYESRGIWLWQRWKGTVLKSTWPSCVATIALGLAMHCFTRWRTQFYDVWPWYAIPQTSDPVMVSLAGVRKAWEFHLTICTFILTFFTSQAFAYWQKIYNKTRMIQGRINDYCMLLVMGAERDSKGEYSRKGLQLVQTCTRLIRMSHIFFWSMQPTASNGLSDSERFLADAATCPLVFDDQHIGPLLLSPYGLNALVESGQLTRKEARALNQSRLPPSQYAYILLTWVGLYTTQAYRDGTLASAGPGMEQNVLQQLTSLRASMFDMDDFRAGRMPLAYVQLVQVLVDSLVGLSPFALYPELGVVSVPLVGLLALFFRGLLTLSKSFLDPFGVEGYEEQNIRVDVLVSEINFGAAQRWIQAGATLPGM